VRDNTRRRYSAARRRGLAALAQARSLSTFGIATWTRHDLHERSRSALDLAGKGVGRLKRGPKDLSTNRGHLDGFGD
jgi:hypothetical protein